MLLHVSVTFYSTMELYLRPNDIVKKVGLSRADLSIF